MRTWKWDMPLQVTFRFFSNQDILSKQQPFGVPCLLKEIAICWRPVLQTTDHCQEYALVLLSASNGVSELLLLEKAFSSFWKSKFSLAHNSGSLAAEVPPEETSGRAMVWGGKILKPPSKLSCLHFEISLAGQKSLCWDICKHSNIFVPHFAHGSYSHVPHL